MDHQSDHCICCMCQANVCYIDLRSVWMHAQLYIYVDLYSVCVSHMILLSEILEYLELMCVYISFHKRKSRQLEKARRYITDHTKDFFIFK